MQTRHILLGHPWQFDKRISYDGHANMYTFMIVIGKSLLYHLPLDKCMRIESERKNWEKSEKQKQDGMAEHVEAKKAINDSTKREKKERKHTLISRVNNVLRAVMSNTFNFVLFSVNYLLQIEQDKVKLIDMHYS